MTTDIPVSRRDSLKGIAIASAVSGVVLAGVSLAGGEVSGSGDDGGGSGDDDGGSDDDGDGAAGGEEGDGTAGDGRSEAGDDETAPADDSGGLRLVPVCSEPEVDLAAFRVDNDADETATVGWEVLEADAVEPAITFPDCETVTVRGAFADVIANVIWWDEEGLAGTISEPVGSVDGERTVNVDEFFGIDPAAGPVVESVEAFEEGTPVVPGGGDVSRENPDARACVDAALADVGDDSADGTGNDSADETDDCTANRTGDGRSERAGEGERRAVLERAIEGELTVPAGGSAFVLAHAPAGEATVGLFHRGERVDVAESGPGTRCRDLGGEAFDDGTLPHDLDRADVLAALDERDPSVRADVNDSPVDDDGE